MTDTWEFRTTLSRLLLWGFVLGLLVFLTVFAVYADNVTLVQSTNVSLACNNSSQCVILQSGGSPVFFTVDKEYNLTLPVSLSFSFEPNVTIVQNVTVVENVTNITIQQNTTNVTVITQVVQVSGCNSSGTVTADISGLQTGVVNSLNGSFAGVCRSACTLGDNDRTILQDAVKIAQQNEFNERVSAESQVNITRIQLAAINDTCQAQVASAKNQTYQWLTVTLLSLSLWGLLVGYIVWKTRTPKSVSAKHVTPVPKGELR